MQQPDGDEKQLVEVAEAVVVALAPAPGEGGGEGGDDDVDSSVVAVDVDDGVVAEEAEAAADRQLGVVVAAGVLGVVAWRRRCCSRWQQLGVAAQRGEEALVATLTLLVARGVLVLLLALIMLVFPNVLIILLAAADGRWWWKWLLPLVLLLVVVLVGILWFRDGSGEYPLPAPSRTVSRPCGALSAAAGASDRLPFVFGVLAFVVGVDATLVTLVVGVLRGATGVGALHDDVVAVVQKLLRESDPLHDRD